VPEPIYRDHNTFGEISLGAFPLYCRRDCRRQDEMKLSTSLQYQPQKTFSLTDDASAPRELNSGLEQEAACNNGTSNEGVVDWDNAADPDNPQNFKSREKWIIIVVVSAITFNQ
jgi:hypothetical protein